MFSCISFSLCSFPYYESYLICCNSLWGIFVYPPTSWCPYWVSSNLNVPYKLFIEHFCITVHRWQLLCSDLASFSLFPIVSCSASVASRYCQRWFPAVNEVIDAHPAVWGALLHNAQFLPGASSNSWNKDAPYVDYDVCNCSTFWLVCVFFMAKQSLISITYLMISITYPTNCYLPWYIHLISRGEYSAPVIQVHVCRQLEPLSRQNFHPPGTHHCWVGRGRNLLNTSTHD